jgi:hypothetical protein
MITPIQAVLTAKSSMNQNDFDSWLVDNYAQLLSDEKTLIHDAMMYAFDEDGHTGPWKRLVIDKYYNDKYMNVSVKKGHNKDVKDIL